MWIRAGSGRVLLEAVRTRFFDLVGRIEFGVCAAGARVAVRCRGDFKLRCGIARLGAGARQHQHDPEDALTAACSTVESVCRSILIELGEGLPDKKDIKALFGAVRKPLGLGSDRPDLDPLWTMFAKY